MNQSANPPIWSGCTPAQVKEALAPLLAFGESGITLDELADLLEQRLVPHLLRYNSPAFQSMFNTVCEPGARLGAILALEWNQGVTNWQVSPGGAVLEECCMAALTRLFGLGPKAGATGMYCGTYANQQALYLALSHAAELAGVDLAQKGLAGFGDPSRLVVLTSADAHFSLRHAVRMLGLGEESLVPVGVDRQRRIDLEDLLRTAARLKPDKQIFCVAATAGTTLTGAVDPIGPIADFCAEQSIWLHVDGAYGLAYQLVPERAGLYRGLEQADSVIWDPHKQLGVPIPNSVLFLRDAAHFNAMTLHSSYFNRTEDPMPNPGLRSAPSTRPFGALPLATSIRHQGINGVIDRLRAPLAAIERLADMIEKASDLQLCLRPDTGILCFRVMPPHCPPEQQNELQRQIHQQINQSATRAIAICQIDDQVALRLVAISPEVTFDALRETVDEARAIAQEQAPSLVNR